MTEYSIGTLVEYIEEGRYKGCRGIITECLGYQTYLTGSWISPIQEHDIVYTTDFQNPEHQLSNEIIPHKHLRKIDDDGKQPGSWDDCIWNPKELYEGTTIPKIEKITRKVRELKS